MTETHSSQRGQRQPESAVIDSDARVLEGLPGLPQLQTWVHRPQALAKCTISDVYKMRTVVYDGAGRYAGRDVFMMDRFPCKMVELVGWVAGVDDKEKSQTVYLDDGDGQHVIAVTVRLSLITPATSDPTNTSQSQSQSSSSNTQDHSRSPRSSNSTPNFKSANERKALRKLATLRDAKGKRPALPPVKVYERNDIRVGDVVKVRGRIDEWMRGKEWIRQVAVEPQAGGSVRVVDPDEQYEHLRQVHELHRTVYSQPFKIPSLPEASTSATPMPSLANTSSIDTSMNQSLSYSDSLSLSIEPSSEMSMTHGHLKLCDPSRLRSSQLTDRTFRQYLLDHMTQEIIDTLTRETAIGGKEGVRASLQGIFPEFRDLWTSSSSQTRRGTQCTPTQHSTGTTQYTPTRHLTITQHQVRARVPFSPSSLHNAIIDLTDIDTFDSETTPRSYKTILRPTPLPSLTYPSQRIEGFTIPALLDVPHLSQLANLVVEEQSRKEEKRRRRRIRDGSGTPKDLAAEGKSWKLTDAEKGARMERLVRWVIRGLSEEGVLVQIQARARLDLSQTPSQSLLQSQLRRKESSTRNDTYAYIPLPEILLFPLLVPHIQAESARRAKTFMRRTDERYGHGILLPEILSRLRQCGEEGRWERVGEWCLEDALAWGEQAGEVRRVGKGWVVV